MPIERVDPLCDTRWEVWLRAFPQANPFHGAGWLRAVHEAYGHDVHGWVLGDGGTVRALMPCVVARSPWLGQRASSVAFADTAAPLVVDHPAWEQLQAAILQRCRAAGWKRLEWRGETGFEKDMSPSTSYWEHVLPLSGGETVARARLTAATRRNVDKALKSGLTAERRESREAMLEYYALHCLTRRRLGTPPQPLRFFESIWRNLVDQGLGFVVLVRSGPAAVAGVVVVHDRRRAVYKYGASDLRHQAARPSNLAMWQAIRECAALGLDELHFGRTSLHQEGLRRFKLGWGARESVLHYYCIDPRSGKDVARPDRVDGWPAAVIRRMPLKAVRALGEILYPHAT